MVKRAGKSQDNAMLAGVGLDCEDGQTRITKGENFLLMGGSADTHELMKETVVKFNENLSRRGKHLGELSREEFKDMIMEAADR